MTVPVVRMQNVSKHFAIRKDNSIKERIVNARRGRQFREEFWALRDIDLTIDAGSTVGLIGPNGSGKSTLLKAIGGIIQPTTGSVQRRGSIAALLELGAGFHPDLTGRENVYLNASILGLSAKETGAHFNDIVEFSGIGEFIDTQVKFYSSGMYVRLAFAVAVHTNPDVLLVDEVLAVGDEAFQKKCLDKIREFQTQGRTIVLVTHTLDQITEFCTRAVVLAHGSVVFDGDPQDAVTVLRSGFDSIMALEAESKPEEEEAEEEEEVTEWGRVDRIRILDSDGTPRREFRTGHDIIIEADVTGWGDVSAWGMGLHVDTPLGQLVIGATSESLRQDPTTRLDGKARARFTIPAPRIGGGQYGVTVALVGSQRQELARLSHDSGFVVAKTEGVWGPLWADVAFHETALDEAVPRKRHG